MSFNTSHQELNSYSTYAYSQDIAESPLSSLYDSNASSPSVDFSETDSVPPSNQPLPDLETTLDHLNDARPGQEPEYPVHILIQCAIQGSPVGKLCLREIIEAIRSKFPLWYNTPERMDKLYVTVRHHLSWYPKFITAGKPKGVPGKSRWWTIEPTLLNEPPKSKSRKAKMKTQAHKDSQSVGPFRNSRTKRTDKASVSRPTPRSSGGTRDHTLKPPIVSSTPSPSSSANMIYEGYQSHRSPESSVASSTSPSLLQTPATPASTHSRPMTPLFPPPQELPPCFIQQSAATGFFAGYASPQFTYTIPVSQAPMTQPLSLLHPFNALSLPADDNSQVYLPYHDASSGYFPIGNTTTPPSLTQLEFDAIVNSLVEPSFIQ
ncbi:hypothetical protein FRC03_001253 [Tulasnella sp. 419]|nr:hypothetical protein FRC03_001253 [Tulasnella sp. 419]